MEKVIKNSNSFVSIIIVTYNGKFILEECLNSLLKVNYKYFEIIIVDNASKDRTKRLVFDFKKKNKQVVVKYIQNKRNVGFASGNNIGIKYADGDYILLLNNDTIVTPNFLTVLTHEIKKSGNIGVVQPKIIFFDSKKLQSGSTFITNLGFLYYEGFGGNQKDLEFNSKKRTFSANGACMLIRKEVIDKVGLFDDDFFAYYEETDFCQRVLMANYSIWYCPKSIIYHKGGVTAKNMSEQFVFYHLFKNRISSILKNFESLNAVKFLTISLVLYLGLAIYYVLTFRAVLSVAVIKSIFWNVSHIYATMQKRSLIQQAVRKIPDSAYMGFLTKKIGFSYYVRLLMNKDQEILVK